MLEPQTSAPPQLATSVAGLLSDLRREGKGSLADALVREIDEAKDAVARFQKSYPVLHAQVIVGRIVGDGLNDASCVGAPMTVHSDGYFVGPVRSSGQPVGFRALGYYPRDITPGGADGTAEVIGLIRLEPVPEPMRAGIKGMLVLEGGAGVSQATASLMMWVEPINLIPPDARPVHPPSSLKLDVQHSGAFAAAGLSPMEYLVSFQAPGHVGQSRSITLTPGETLNLGEVVLERARRITLAYRIVASPPFTQTWTVKQTVLPREPLSGIGVLFDQKQGEVRFMVPSASIADLGSGTLDDYFLKVNPASVHFTPPRNLVAQSGHVYLLEHKALKRWVLFRLELGPKAPP